MNKDDKRNSDKERKARHKGFGRYVEWLVRPLDFLKSVADKKPAKSPASQAAHAAHFNVSGSQINQYYQARTRMKLSMALFILAYVIIGGRLVQYGLMETGDTVRLNLADPSISAHRPDIVDRNGAVLATDLNTASLYGEPRRIVDVDEAVEKLTTVLPGLDISQAHKRLSSKAGFVWLQRELTPAQQSKIHALGIPGIGFKTETKRFYTNGRTAGHVVGYVNIDNVGIAGLERSIDNRGLKDLRAAGFTNKPDLEPIVTSLDLRVQHVVHDELLRAMHRYKAIAAGAIVFDVNTGEVVAMASVPDYDSNDPEEALEKGRFNRISGGTFEMGSIFKAFTAAMALDSGKVVMNSRFDARKPIEIKGYTINDFHAQKRILTVPEIFIYSSNIGSAKMTEVVGMTEHRAFLERLGLSQRTDFELPETATPIQPKHWQLVNSMTVSFGHGLSTTPLQTAAAAASLVNGGKFLPPTLFPRTKADIDALTRQVLQRRTSDQMRHLFRLNVEKGSGKRAEVEGYWVGGKTGTAEKVINGKYSRTKLFNTFLAAFPMHDPQYVVLAFVDEPQPEPGQDGATASVNAAPLVGNIVRRSGPILGVKPNFGPQAPIIAGWQ